MPEPQNRHHGLVIMFDGPDGVGKTTQVRLAKAALEEKGFRVHTTRVHGGTPIGEELRKVSLLDLPRPSATDLHISLAMYHALAEDLEQHRQAGDICLVDRSPLSTIAYQVYGSGLDPMLGKQGAEESLALIKPDLLICYEAPLALLLKRRDERLKHDAQVGQEFFELQSNDYMERVAQGYADASQAYHALCLNASGSIEAIHQETMRHIMPLVTV